MLTYYILDENDEPRECADMRLWANWMVDNHENYHLLDKVGGAEVSTVFLGVAHSQRAQPFLFETLVVDGGPELECVTARYSDYEDAKRGHQAIVGAAREAAMRGLTVD